MTDLERLGDLVAVALGGAAGTLARFAVAQAWPQEAGEPPWATLVVNLVGAFTLGVLLGRWQPVAAQGPGGAAARAGRTGAPAPQSRAGRRLRLALGTGLLGGLTTYSTFVLETHRLLGSGHVALGAAYGVGSLAVGLAAALLGLRIGAAGPRGTGAAGPRPTRTGAPGTGTPRGAAS